MESRNVKLLELILDGTIEPRDVKLSALESITENFSEERIIGEGRFATVYKGILRNGEVAVKRIKNNQTIDEKLFRREVNSLLNVSHKNIVRFLGFCSHTEQKAIDFEGSGEYILAKDRERILCFEYINNGSLEKYTADELRGLPWDTRVLVIKGICEGLQYLHMKEHIIHRDLKPANILIDINMVAKITDFGLSRMEKNAETKSTARISSLGYTAPEYIEKGEMSAKYDVYSLGIIIIEMVTGSRNIPDSNNVLRRWRHRLRKSGKDTPFVYQQIAKLVEIGLLCQEKDPYRRPSISDIIRDINELESIDRQISNANESMAEQISPYLEDDMLGIELLELRFPFELNSQISSSIELTNKTNAFIAFIIQTTSPLPYFIQPNKDIVAPRSQYIVNITLQSLDKAPQDRGCIGDFIVRSTKVNESITSEDITEDTFNRDEGQLVDEVNLTIACEAESKTSSNELIKFDPPELCLPLLPNQRVLSSVKVVNITDQYIGFRICTTKSNSARYYANPPEGILPPLSTKALLVTRIAEENELEESQCKDNFLLWNGIVPKDMKARDVIDNMSDTKCTTLPIVLTKTNSSLSDDLIQFDPPELHFPFLPNKKVLTSIKIVNLTDYNVGFNTYSRRTNAAWYHTEPPRGILPPQSTQKLMVTREQKEDALKDNQFDDKYFVWKSIVSDGVEDSELSDYMADQQSKELPIVLDKLKDMAERLPPEHGAYECNEAKQVHVPNSVEPHVAIYSSMNGKIHPSRTELLNASNAHSPNTARSPHSNGILSQHKLLSNISENSEGSIHSLRITSPHEADRPHRRAHSNSDEMLSASSRADDNVSIDARSLQNGEDGDKPRGTISISSNQVQAEWIEQVEPGVYITLTTLRDGTRDLKRIRFSRRRFGEHQVENWWNENRDKVYERYNYLRNSERVSSAASTRSAY